MLEYTHESIGVRIDRRGAGLSRLVRHTTRVDQPSFGDIWFWFVSVSPAPHIYQRGELVREPLCTIHGHYPGYLVVGPAGQGGTGDGPHPSCLHIDPAARPVLHVTSQNRLGPPVEP